MKKIIILIWSMCLTTSIFAEEMCNVQICNKIERVSLNPLAHMSDNFNETCYDITLPKNQSQVVQFYHQILDGTKEILLKNLLLKLRKLTGVDNDIY